MTCPPVVAPRAGTSDALEVTAPHLLDEAFDLVGQNLRRIAFRLEYDDGDVALQHDGPFCGRR